MQTELLNKPDSKTAKPHPAMSRADSQVDTEHPSSSALPLFVRGGEQTKAVLQPKLTINATGDIYEHEADRVAEQVMRMPEPRPAASVPGATSGLQRKCECGGTCAECQNQEQDERVPRLQMKSATPGGAGLTTAPPSVHEVLSSPGQPLDPATRAFMEPRFGHDFSGVRVHTDSAAAASAKEIRARAYTAANDIVFAGDQFSPSTSQGSKLLAHELAHVVQQGGAATAIQRNPDDKNKEGGEEKKEERQGPISPTEERIRQVANKKVTVGVYVRIEMSGDPTEDLGVTKFEEQDKNRAEALRNEERAKALREKGSPEPPRGTGRAVQLPQVENPPKSPGKKGFTQPSSGVVVEPVKGSQTLEVLAWNTGDPVSKSDVSHAEAQVENWLDTRDPKWLARVKSVSISVFGRDICEECEGRIKYLKDRYKHINFTWERSDSGAPLENFKIKTPRKPSPAGGSGGKPGPGRPATQPAKPPLVTEPAKPSSTTESAKSPGTKPTTTTKPSDIANETEIAAQTRRIASRGIQGINTVVNLTNVHNVQEFGQAAANEAMARIAPRLMKFRAVYDSLKQLYASWGTEDFWIVATQQAYTWVLDALGPMGQVIELAYRGHFAVLNSVLEQSNFAHSFEKSIADLQTAAGQFDLVLDGLKKVESELPMPVDLESDFEFWGSLPQAFDYLDEYWRIAVEVWNRAMDLRSKISQLIGTWDHMMGLAEQVRDLTLKTVWESVQLLDFRFSNRGGGFRRYLESVRDRASTVEYWAHIRVAWADEVMGSYGFYGKYFRRWRPLTECTEALKDDPTRFVQECVLNRWEDWIVED
jgi:uncharacterized protein DUF4157